MPVLLRPVNNFPGQVMGNASERKYNTVNNSSSGKVTFQKCLNSGITLFHLKIATSHKHSPLVYTGIMYIGLYILTEILTNSSFSVMAAIIGLLPISSIRFARLCT